MERYKELVAADNCTAEEQAGPHAKPCPVCKRVTLHQYTGECMDKGCAPPPPCPSCKEHLAALAQKEDVIRELAIELMQTECYGFEVACSGNGFNCAECPKVAFCVKEKTDEAERRVEGKKEDRHV